MAAEWQEQAHRKGPTSTEAWHLKTAHINVHSLLIFSVFHKFSITKCNSDLHSPGGVKQSADTFKCTYLAVNSN